MEPSRRVVPLLVALTLGLVALAWAPSFRAPFVYDDLAEIVTNRSLHDLSQPLRIVEYNPARPLLLLSFAVDWHLWGRNTVPWHAVNLTIHLLCCLLVGWLAARLLRGRALEPPPAPPWIPALCAMIFAVHPLFVESVTYIASRSSTLCALFYLLTLVAYSRFRDAQAAAARAWPWYVATALAAAAAVATKEEAASLPLALLLFDLTLAPSPPTPLARRWAPLTLPFLLLVAMLALRLHLVGELNPGPQVRTPLENLWTQSWVVLRYLGLFVAPQGLSIYHDVRARLSPLEVEVALSLLIHAALVWTAVRWARRGSAAAFPLLWFYLTLLPTSSVVPLKEAMAEHRAYLPGIGLIAGLGLVMARVRAQRFLVPLGVGVACGLASLTWGYNQIYTDDVALWRRATSLAPHSGDAWYALGDALRRRGQLEQALVAYQRAIDEYEALGLASPLPTGGSRVVYNYPDALNNLGLTLALMGDLDGAIAQLAKAARAFPDFSGQAWTNLGFAYLKKGEYAQAMNALQQAIVVEPTNVVAHLHLANLFYAFLPDRERALEHYREVLALSPGHSQRAAIEQRIVELSY